MSYLPRMSSTYKEPKAPILNEPVDNFFYGTLQPASSLANENTHNPQVALKHYKYFPHPLPVLPGPSVADEANELELLREASRLRRSISKNTELSSATSHISLEKAPTESSQISLDEVKPIENVQSPQKRIHPRKGSTHREHKVSEGKKKISKLGIEKKKYISKPLVNVYLVESEGSKPFSASQADRPESSLSKNYNTEFLSKSENKNLRREKTFSNSNTSNLLKSNRSSVKNNVEKTIKQTARKSKSTEKLHRGIQCAFFGNFDTTYVIPPIISTLLKSLTFLLQEVYRDEANDEALQKETKLMNQIQLILKNMCDQSVNKNIAMDITYSDSKRIEKVLEELKKYIKNIYTDKKKFISKREEFKKLFIELKLKELELSFLYDKAQEDLNLQLVETEFKESDYKSPEVTLQNKRLESEQLLAEVEFSNIELLKQRKVLAELDWDIKMGYDHLSGMKKSLSSKSRAEVLGKKSSSLKFQADTSGKIFKGKESDEFGTKKRREVDFVATENFLE